MGCKESSGWKFKISQLAIETFLDFIKISKNILLHVVISIAHSITDDNIFWFNKA